MSFREAIVISILALASAAFAEGERINHEGRLLGPAPHVTQPLLFNTPEADAIVSAMQIMPVTSPWNERIDQRPLLANSAAMISQITSDLASGRRTLRPFYEMNYVLVPDSQLRVPIAFLDYPDESDLDGGSGTTGRYPIPNNQPIETWPLGTGTLTLQQWQHDVNDDGGDRHSIAVAPGLGSFWETWQAKLVGSAWQASNGAKWNLNSNALRPAGWTSADAAGLPLFPALVRYDECQRGMVEHALRLVVKRTRLGPIYPATHAASVGNLTNPNIPAMGQRLRLKANFVIPATWTKEEKAVLLALKKYGAIVADNGGFFSVSVCPDSRFPPGCFDHLSTVSISNFEVVQTTGGNEGPRSPGAPAANAGPDFAIPFGATATLPGSVTGAGTLRWTRAAGPGAVTFANPAAATTAATFSQPGDYTLLLAIDDNVHAIAFDAVRVTVVLPVSITRDRNDVLVHFPTIPGKNYRVEVATALGGSSQGWATLMDNVAGTGNISDARHVNAFSQPACFYRVTVLPP
jgi:hypothetical protein